MHSRVIMNIGECEIHFLGHSGFLVSNGKRIAVDPYNVSADVEKVDVILLTNDHFDHCIIKDIQRLARAGTMVVGPAHIQSAITKVENVQLHVIEVGDVVSVDDIKIEAVPAYNVNKYRDAGKKLVFHPKSEG